MRAKNKALKMFAFEQIKDEFIGKIGTEKRMRYEQELQIEVLGEMVRKARLQRNLTQEELGKLVGVQRAQISKLENRMTNVTMETVLKIFGALKAKVNFNVELMAIQCRLLKEWRIQVSSVIFYFCLFIGKMPRHSKLLGQGDGRGFPAFSNTQRRDP